jgi:hypothetical protein
MPVARVASTDKDDVDQARPIEKGADNKRRGGEDKLKENRENLGVNEEHKTPAMEKGHRGTFP